MILMRQKAAVLKALWQVIRTPPGSESGACIQRGNLGTWENHVFPCKVEALRDADPPEGQAPGTTRISLLPLL